MYYNKYKTSNLIKSYNFSPSTELLHETNIVYMLKKLLGDCVSNEDNTYVGLTTKTISRRLTKHRNDSSSLAQHLKSHIIPKSKFRKILVENTTIIEHGINKLQLQILEAFHKKTTRNNSVNFENSDNVLKFSCFLYSISLDYILFP